MDTAYQIFPLHQITEHIDRLLRADASQRARFSPYLWKLFTDIQVLEEITRQVRRYCPKIFWPGRKYSILFSQTIQLDEPRRI
jgi:hypothetical protein